MLNSEPQSSQVNLEFRHCPNCQNKIPVNKEFVSWCEACNWNLKPHQPAPARNIFELNYSRLSKKLSAKLYNDMLKSKADLTQRSASLSRFLVLALATSVHLLNIVLVLFGGFIIWITWPSALAIVLGLVFILTGWFIRPRPSKINQDGVVTRDNYPELYSLVDQVAAVMQTSSVDFIKVNEEFNAAISEHGWRKKERKKVLYIGLPLFNILTEQEKVALIAHELGHCISGDPARGFYTRSALSTLIELYQMLRPEKMRSYNTSIFEGLVMIANFFSNLLLRFLNKLVYLVIAGFNRLIFYQSQHAEYLADLQAAKISGSAAMISMLEKLHYDDTYSLTVQKVALMSGKLNLFDEFSRQLSLVPAREIERLKRVSRLYKSVLDASHPPTAYRMDFIASLNYPPLAGLKHNQEKIKLLNQELASLRKILHERLVDKFLDNLYY